MNTVLHLILRPDLYRNVQNIRKYRNEHKVNSTYRVSIVLILHTKYILKLIYLRIHDVCIRVYYGEDCISVGRRRAANTQTRPMKRLHPNMRSQKTSYAHTYVLDSWSHGHSNQIYCGPNGASISSFISAIVQP